MKRILCIGLPPEQRPAACETHNKSLEVLAAWCNRYSPWVAIETAPPPSLWLDISGLAHLFGGEASLAETIASELGGRGFDARVAIADTIGAAWAVAHFAAGTVPRAAQGGQSHFRRLLRSRPKIGTVPGPKIGTVPITIVPPGEMHAALAPLPVAALRLPDEILAMLHSLGIQRIEQFARLPREELSSRFGPRLLERWDQATGQRGESLPAFELPPRFVADWSCEYPIARPEMIDAALEHLLGRLTAMLAQCGRGAMQLECRLLCDAAEHGVTGAGKGCPSPSVCLSVGLFQPTAQAAHLFSLLQLQRERAKLYGPVREIRIEAPLTAPLEYRQQELFPDESDRRHPRHLAGLVERLSSRLGPQAVVRVRLLAESQPELAFRYEPVLKKGISPICLGLKKRPRKGDSPIFAGAKIATVSRDAKIGRVRRLPPRPLRLLRRPVAVAATAVVPEGPPVQFQAFGGRHRVASAWGPERIETGWWRGRLVGRDYYQVETTAGRRFWLFRRLRDGRWFLHGMFS